MIEVPTDLLREWVNEAPGEFKLPVETARFLLNKAARWGTLQKLEDLLNE